MDGLFDGLTITDYHGDLHRNIVSLRTSEDLFDDLTDNPAGQMAALDLELAAKPHTYRSHLPAIDRPFEESDYNNAIQYPFVNWTKSRYSDGSYGVWYGADALETTIHETVFHWRYQLLADAGWQDLEGVISERKIYHVRCGAGLLNFKTKLADFPALVDPDPEGYHLTQQVGARIHHDGHPGLITRSARCDGDVFAIFTPRVLSSPRQRCYLTYRLDKGIVTVERSPGEVLLRL